MTRALLLLLLPACLSPLVSDEVVTAGRVLPAGTAIPALADDPALAAQLAANDGVDGVVPLLAGFASGAPAAYWDFGPAADFAAPLFILHRRNGDTLEPLAHPPIVGAIPGDPGYSPYWRPFVVEVTARYAGEVLPSVEALTEARERGLVLAATSMSDVAVNCPIVAADVRLDPGDGTEPTAAAGAFYYRGRRGYYFDLGPTPLAADKVHVVTQPLYTLRREGGEPLRERARAVDMTGDGDLLDSNDILGLGFADEAHTSGCRLVEITVPAGTGSIDDTGDQTLADLRGAADLFVDGVPTTAVVSQHDTGTLINCPQRSVP